MKTHSPQFYRIGRMLPLFVSYRVPSLIFTRVEWESAVSWKIVFASSGENIPSLKGKTRLIPFSPPLLSPRVHRERIGGIEILTFLLIRNGKILGRSGQVKRAFLIQRTFVIIHPTLNSFILRGTYIFFRIKNYYYYY